MYVHFGVIIANEGGWRPALVPRWIGLSDISREPTAIEPGKPLAPAFGRYSCEYRLFSLVIAGCGGLAALSGESAHPLSARLNVPVFSPGASLRPGLARVKIPSTQSRRWLPSLTELRRREVSVVVALGVVVRGLGEWGVGWLMGYVVFPATDPARGLLLDLICTLKRSPPRNPAWRVLRRPRAKGNGERPPIASARGPQNVSGDQPARDWGCSRFTGTSWSAALSGRIS